MSKNQVQFVGIADESDKDWLGDVVKALKVDPKIAVEAPRRAYKPRVNRTARVVATPEQRRAKKRAEWRRERITPAGMLRQLRRQYRYFKKNGKAGNWDLDIRLEDWKKLWEMAGEVFFHGRMVPAHLARVLQRRKKSTVPYDLTEAVQVRRIDPSKALTIDNVKVIYQRRTIADGRNVRV